MSLDIRFIDTIVTHALGFALQFQDHFTGQPIEDTLRVSMASGRILPALTSDGRRRASDGTYRFVGLPVGSYAVEFSSPSGRYTSWDPPLAVSVPLANPQLPVKRDLWPTPMAPVPLGMTAIRGKILGSTFRGVTVRIAKTGTAPVKFTRSDAWGELLFMLPDPIAPPQDESEIRLTVELDGGALPVTGTDVITGGVRTHFPGPQFKLTPGRESRVKFQVA